jgi:hypothetical protein
MVQATSVKAKVCGLFVEKTEIGKPGDFSDTKTCVEIAERLLLEINPNIRITDEKREMVLAELDRHIASVAAIAADDNAQQH